MELEKIQLPALSASTRYEPQASYSYFDKYEDLWLNKLSATRWSGWTGNTGSMDLTFLLPQLDCSYSLVQPLQLLNQNEK